MQAAVGTAARYLGVSNQSPAKEISPCQSEENSSRFSPKPRINQNVSNKVGLISLFFNMPYVGDMNIVYYNIWLIETCW